MNQISMVQQMLSTINTDQDLPVLLMTLQTIKITTKQDQEMQLLIQFITRGWPNRPDDVPEPIKPYVSYRDELTVAMLLYIEVTE